MKFYDILEKEPVVLVRYGRKFVPGGDVVRLEKKEGATEVYVSSAKPIRFVKITWSLPGLSEGAQVLGDAFERGYGDLFGASRRGENSFGTPPFPIKRILLRTVSKRVVRRFAIGKQARTACRSFWTCRTARSR